MANQPEDPVVDDVVFVEGSSDESVQERAVFTAAGAEGLCALANAASRQNAQRERKRMTAMDLGPPCDNFLDHGYVAPVAKKTATRGKEWTVLESYAAIRYVYYYCSSNLEYSRCREVLTRYDTSGRPPAAQRRRPRRGVHSQARRHLPLPPRGGRR
jgi:hypothetical protein